MRSSCFAAATFVLCSICACSPSVAKADSYNFAISGTGIFATGTLTTQQDPSLAGVQDITGLTGMLSNGSITGDPNSVGINLIAVMGNPSELIFPTGPNSNFSFTYDNFLYPGASELLDGNGLAFSSADGLAYNVAFDAKTNSLVYEAFNNSISFDQLTYYPPPVSFTITPVSAVTPEPSSFLLLGTGLLGAAGMLRRRASRV